MLDPRSHRIGLADPPRRATPPQVARLEHVLAASPSGRPGDRPPPPGTIHDDASVTTSRPRAAHLGPEIRRPMLLDAAMQIYLRDGVDAITMEALAAEAHVTKPVVYACFPNRDAVLAALMDLQSETVARHMADALAAAHGSPTVEQALRVGFATLLRRVQAEPDAYRASVLLEHGATAALMHRMREVGVQLIDAIGDEMRRRLEERGTPTTPEAAYLVGHTVVHLARGYILLLLGDDPPSVETLAGLAARATLAVGDELGIEAD
jgi:AcrR family transcriptional regulator